MADVQTLKRELEFGDEDEASESQMVGIDGKPLKPWDILRRLEKKTPVLVSVSGKMVDPYYLQLAQPDTLIILLSRIDGRGDHKLLPKFLPVGGAVVELIGLGDDTTDAVFDGEDRLNKPIQITKKEELAKYFAPQHLRALEETDFDRRVVLIFAWKGSGQDKLSFDEGFGIPAVEFRLSPGLTKDLRRHVHVFVVRSDFEWHVVRENGK